MGLSSLPARLTRLAILATLLNVLPSPTSAAFSSNSTACTRTYTVKSGDTCDKIGQKTWTSTYQILAFNLPQAGSSCYTLEIGATLCLGRYGNDCQFVHRATDADTCSSIAQAYGISQQLLLDNNPALDCDVVYDGLMLCVAPGTVRPPADNRLNATLIRLQQEQRKHASLTRIRQEEEEEGGASDGGKKIKNTGRHKLTSHTRNKTKGGSDKASSSSSYSSTDDNGKGSANKPKSNTSHHKNGGHHGHSLPHSPGRHSHHHHHQQQQQQQDQQQAHQGVHQEETGSTDHDTTGSDQGSASPLKPSTSASSSPSRSTTISHPHQGQNPLGLKEGGGGGGGQSGRSSQSHSAHGSGKGSNQTNPTASSDSKGSDANEAAEQTLKLDPVGSGNLLPSY